VNPVVSISIQLVKYLFTKLDDMSANRRTQIIHYGNLDAIDTNLPLLFYIHYSKNDSLSKHEVETLRSLRKMGIQVCLVLNSDNPRKSLLGSEEEITQDHFNLKVIRKNKGYDLAAYRDAFFLFKSTSRELRQPIFFMNSSIFWFPQMIESYFNKLLVQEYDIVSGSISEQYRRHIQTFLFGALTTDGVNQIESWFKTVKNWRLKKSIVSLGEIRTNLILKNNLKVMDFPKLSEVQEISIKKLNEGSRKIELSRDNSTLNRLRQNRNFLFNGIQVNPSHAYWLERVELGFPGIKIDLVRNNPSGVDDYETAISYLMKFGYTLSEINRTLTSNPIRSFKIKIRSRMNW
jgi:hypothetical protein